MVVSASGAFMHHPCLDVGQRHHPFPAITALHLAIGSWISLGLQLKIIVSFLSLLIGCLGKQMSEKFENI